MGYDLGHLREEISVRTRDEAGIRFNGVNFDAIEEFVGGDTGTGTKPGEVVVATRQGPLYFGFRDWIVKRVDGTFYTTPVWP